MDRQLKKGVIGLHMLWLSDTTAKTKKEHDKYKARMSSIGGFLEREKAREMYTNIANDQKGIYEDILRAEALMRGDNTEPIAVQM